MYFLSGSFINFMRNLFNFLPSFWEGGSDIFNDSRLFINSFFSLLFSLLPFSLCFMLHLLCTLFDILFFLISFGLHFFHTRFNIGWDIGSGLLDIFSSEFKARMWSDNIETFLWIFGWECCIHTESFDNNFEIILMFVYIGFKAYLLDIAHVDGFVNRKRVIILKNLNFIRADSDTWIFVKDCFCLHF